MRIPGLFITGTDTNVGKTFITCGIARTLINSGLRVGAYKPAVSGAQRDTSGQKFWRDVEELWEATGSQFPRERVAPQCFATPLAPPAAARAEHRTVDSALLRSGVRWWEGECDLLLVEGVGGLLSPLADQETVADLACDLGFPLIVVARLGLGTINHTLLTLEAAERRHLNVVGIILNETVSNYDDPSTATNAADITDFTDVPVLATVLHQTSDCATVLDHIAWAQVAGI